MSKWWKIHSKGTLILNGYILSCLGGIHTWPLGISLCMEQAYESVDGDSASSAEAYAVLSALSDIPLKQGIAATGAIDQFGNVRAVGNVTEKVESFYRLCHRRGLTGSQGVIIPKANVDDLVLSSEIIRSLECGKFHIWAVETLSEGIEILSDTQMGVLRGDRYPKRSIMGRIQSTIDMADT